MSKQLNLKAIINKKNGQINFSLPKRKLPKKILKNSDKIKGIKIILEDFY